MLENTIRQYLSSFEIPFRYDNKIVVWENVIDKIPPTEKEIQTKIAELQAAEPMRLLRLERNRRLTETDWRFRIDQEPSQAWYEYCQELRDLPANSEPQLDENGNLTNVTWPTPPGETNVS